jgi:hypothetical protein
MKNALAILIFTLCTGLSSRADTITIAHQNNYPPYASIDKSGEAQGVLIDWWRLWGAKTGTEIKFVGGTSEECVDMVLNDGADVVAGTFIQDSTMDLKYSEYILRVNTVLILKKGLKPQSVHEIKDSICVMKDELSHVVIKEMFPHLKLKLFDSAEDLLENISKKSIIGFVYEFPNPFGTKVQIPAPDGYYVYHEIRSDKIRPAVKSGNEELIQSILKGSAKITDEELIEIAKNNDLYIIKSNTSWLFAVIGIIIAVFIIVFVFQKRKSQKQAKQIANYKAKDWQTIISKGENDKIEFKSSLRWDYRQNKVNKVLEHVIVKTISAFLNTDGGMLFIGVDDDGNIPGLQKDYQALSKNNSDGFMLALTNLINQSLGKNVHRLIKINIISINEIDVCIVTIEKSDKPVFLGNKGNEEFYMRASASSQPLSMSEAYDYIKNHWDGKN